MKFNDLEVSKRRQDKRVGRGISAGQGKTAGRGTKGQNARTGSKHYATFMGGQGPLMRRIPKHRGFKSIRVPAQNVYTGQLNDFNGKTADNAALAEAGLIATPFHSVKIILRGELKAKVTVRVQGASEGAKKAIADAGGSFEAVDVPHLPASKKVKKEPKKETEKK